MNLMVCATLFPHIFPYRLLIPVLTDGIRVESTRPEPSSPQYFSYLRVANKYLLGGYALCDLSNAGWRQLGHALNEEMHMVLICAYLNEVHLVSISDSPTYVRQGMFHGFGKNLSPIFRRAYEVVEQQRFIVSPEDMFAHTAILPRSRASRNYLIKSFEVILHVRLCLPSHNTSLIHSLLIKTIRQEENVDQRRSSTKLFDVETVET